MGTRTERVMAAIAACDGTFRAVGTDMRVATERIEELWFEIDDQIRAMEQAERRGDHMRVTQHISAIIQRVVCIRSQMLV